MAAHTADSGPTAKAYISTAGTGLSPAAASFVTANCSPFVHPRDMPVPPKVPDPATHTATETCYIWVNFDIPVVQDGTSGTGYQFISSCADPLSPQPINWATTYGTTGTNDPYLNPMRYAGQIVNAGIADLFAKTTQLRNASSRHRVVGHGIKAWVSKNTNISRGTIEAGQFQFGQTRGSGFQAPVANATTTRVTPFTNAPTSSNYWGTVLQDTSYLGHKMSVRPARDGTIGFLPADEGATVRWTDSTGYKFNDSINRNVVVPLARSFGALGRTIGEISQNSLLGGFGQQGYITGTTGANNYGTDTPLRFHPQIYGSDRSTAYNAADYTTQATAREVGCVAFHPGLRYASGVLPTGYTQAAGIHHHYLMMGCLPSTVNATSATFDPTNLPYRTDAAARMNFYMAEQLLDNTTMGRYSVALNTDATDGNWQGANYVAPTTTGISPLLTNPDLDFNKGLYIDIRGVDSTQFITVQAVWQVEYVPLPYAMASGEASPIDLNFPELQAMVNDAATFPIVVKGRSFFTSLWHGMKQAVSGIMKLLPSVGSALMAAPDPRLKAIGVTAVGIGSLAGGGSRKRYAGDVD